MRETDMIDALQPGAAVTWAGHDGVYVIIEQTDHAALLRKWGEIGPMVWTMCSALTSIGENEAVARLCRAFHQKGNSDERAI